MFITPTPQLPASFIELQADPDSLHASEARVGEIGRALEVQLSSIATKEAHLRTCLASLSRAKETFTNAIEHVRNLSSRRAVLGVDAPREDYGCPSSRKRGRALLGEGEETPRSDLSSRLSVRRCIRRAEVAPIRLRLPGVSRVYLVYVHRF